VTRGGPKKSWKDCLEATSGGEPQIRPNGYGNKVGSKQPVILQRGRKNGMTLGIRQRKNGQKADFGRPHLLRGKGDTLLRGKNKKKIRFPD